MYLSIRNVLCECDCLLAPWGKKLNQTLKPCVRTATRTKRRRALLYPITEHYTQSTAGAGHLGAVIALCCDPRVVRFEHQVLSPDTLRIPSGNRSSGRCESPMHRNCLHLCCDPRNHYFKAASRPKLRTGTDSTTLALISALPADVDQVALRSAKEKT